MYLGVLLSHRCRYHPHPQDFFSRHTYNGVLAFREDIRST